jgi:putative endopeptidase
MGYGCVVSALQTFYRAVSRLLLLAAATWLPACATLTNSAAGKQAGHGIDLTAIDRGVDACENFNQFANGNWLKNNPVPADQSRWGAFNELLDRNLVRLRDLASAAADDPSSAGPRRLVGDFYSSAMNVERIDGAGSQPLAPHLARIDAISDRPALRAALASMHASLTSPSHYVPFKSSAAFTLTTAPDEQDSRHYIAELEQSGLGLPDRDYYVNQDEKSRSFRAAYRSHLERMFSLLGYDAGSAKRDSAIVLAMETELAQASMTRVERRNPHATYNKMTLAQVEELTPGFGWSAYFADLEVAQPPVFNVRQPAFFKTFARLFNEDWKAYLRWHLLRVTAPLLSADFVDEDFAFYGKTLRGTQQLRPRWKRIADLTSDELGDALGRLYSAGYFPASAKQRAIELVRNIRGALRERLEKLDWMSEETRRQALRKLDSIAVKIGYPERWKDYSGVSLDRASLVDNVMRLNAYEFKRKVSSAGKTVDHNDWLMPAQMVNAYYSPERNEIVFPAGILQPPFFDAQANDAANYGGIGMVIGHELTHGFDDQGRQYDAEGNLKTWWTADDEKQFKERAAFVEAQYNAYAPLEELHINGKLTLGENIADIGGLKIAYSAFLKANGGRTAVQPLGGFNAEQQFFIAYAQIWRSNIRPEELRVRLQTDPHSPAEFRIKGPLDVNPDFLRAFGCAAAHDASAMVGQRAIW